MVHFGPFFKKTRGRPVQGEVNQFRAANRFMPHLFNAKIKNIETHLVPRLDTMVVRKVFFFWVFFWPFLEIGVLPVGVFLGVLRNWCFFLGVFLEDISKLVFLKIVFFFARFQNCCFYLGVFLWCFFGLF